MGGSWWEWGIRWLVVVRRGPSRSADEGDELHAVVVLQFVVELRPRRRDCLVKSTHP